MDGDEVEFIYLLIDIDVIFKNVVVMDILGIDLIDDVYCVLIELVFYLVDVIFYVMDYNYV